MVLPARKREKKSAEGFFRERKQDEGKPGSRCSNRSPTPNHLSRASTAHSKSNYPISLSRSWWMCCA